MKALYTIIFSDNSNYIGGDYFNTGWTQIPKKRIKRIIYQLPNGDNLVLNNYEEYFHMPEATKDITGKNKGQIKLEFGYIMGKRKGIITVYKVALFKNSDHEIGNIEKILYKEENKFIVGLNKKGWIGKKKNV